MTAADNAAHQAIAEGRTALGIELGSTRIKAVLIGADHAPMAVGAHSWENQFVDRRWTYSLDAVWAGLQACYRSLAAEVQSRYGLPLTTVGGLGVSAMMHGYLPFDAAGDLLTPFRTWRNTNTGPAVEQLSTLFDYNIPHRWSIAHLYQAVLDGEDHVGRIAHLTTLAGYVHWRLTGEQVLGVGDASGMFPIDTRSGGYDATMASKFDDLVADRGLPPLTNLLPTIRRAGEPAGVLTPAGALLLDPSGTLRPGAPACPPEGDAGTGMVATNSVAPRTGNVSAGTSIFAMVVLEHELSRVHHQLDLVTTPAGDLVAMAHCNNGASELDAWAGLFAQFATAAGVPLDSTTVFTTLFRAALRLGLDVLLRDEGVRLDTMFAHGGLFTTKGVAQRFLAAAIDPPVSVAATASEGGPWGMAVLAAYLIHRAPDQTLADYLTVRVFADADVDEIKPDPTDVAGFNAFIERYLEAMPVQRAAVAHS